MVLPPPNVTRALHIGHALTAAIQDIIRLPRLFRFLQRPLAQLIYVLRAHKSKEAYASIGGGSPLRKITCKQVDALKSELEAYKVSANV
ncbi:ferrochelatase-2, chloroplastic-like protein [Tanacetum coccineum]